MGAEANKEDQKKFVESRPEYKAAEEKKQVEILSKQQEAEAQRQRDLATQQQTGLQAQQQQGDVLAQQQAEAYKQFDPQKYAQQISALNAYNAQRMGANAGKAARIGGFGQEGALAEGTRQKMALGSAATGAVGQQQDVYGRAIGQAGTQALGEGQLGLQQKGLQFQKTQDELNRERQNRQDLIGGLTGLAGGGAALLSDERTKEDIQPVSLMDMAKNIKPVSFKYKKSQQLGTDKHVGVIAQDLEKSPATENTVKEIDTPDGKRKAIDTGELSTVNTGAISELARHIIRLEDELNKRGK